MIPAALERWLYRLVRKSAGHQRRGWTWKMRALHERSGTVQDLRFFARAIRRVVRDAEGCLLDYELKLDTQNGEEVLSDSSRGR